MIELDDCGKTLLIGIVGDEVWNKQSEVKVIMVIKAPRGTMALFSGYMHEYQCPAIKAFMEEHKEE